MRPPQHGAGMLQRAGHHRAAAHPRHQSGGVRTAVPQPHITRRGVGRSVRSGGVAVWAVCGRHPGDSRVCGVPHLSTWPAPLADVLCSIVPP